MMKSIIVEPLHACCLFSHEAQPSAEAFDTQFEIALGGASRLNKIEPIYCFYR